MKLESVEKLRGMRGNMATYEDLIRECCVIADEIEREISERYIELPVDADGVPIHVGDVLETSEYGKRFTCTGYSYQTAGYEKPHWSIAYRYDNYDGTTEFVSLHSCRHVKPDPVKELLCEFASDVSCMGDGVKRSFSPDEKCIVELADAIREVVGE